MPTQTYTILIGINSYANLGASYTLKGSLNDVKAWKRYVQNQLDVDPKLVEVLTSPALDPADIGLPEAQVRTATMAQVDAAMQNMKTWLKANANGTAILMFSGHGASLGGETSTPEGRNLAMVMADATLSNGNLTGALLFDWLVAMLYKEGLCHRVTVIVDACYDHIKAHAIGTEADTLAQESTQTIPRTRLMLGAALGTTAYESQIGDEWRSVFSFCLITMLSQWKTGVLNNVTYVAGTYQNIVFRTRSMMESMGYTDQQPLLAGAPPAPSLPFNYPSISANLSLTTPLPNGNRDGKEVGSGADVPGIWVFTINQTPSGGSTTSTTILAYGTTQASGTTNNLTVNNFANIPGGQSAIYATAGSTTIIENLLPTPPVTSTMTLMYNLGNSGAAGYTVTLPTGSGTWAQVQAPTASNYSWSSSTPPTTSIYFGPYTLYIGRTSYSAYIQLVPSLSSSPISYYIGSVAWWVQSNPSAILTPSSTSETKNFVIGAAAPMLTALPGTGWYVLTDTNLSNPNS